ncbi:MAG TPA: lipopolysaccharide transport periplasmic protein LptA [Thermohalobaculum sp.]|nr:lipopolysaccharide transport periplasmic protein LptA [Thermohalobaculum sp.]
MPTLPTARLFAAALVAALVAAPALAQQTAATGGSGSGPFGGFRHDSSAPIEVTSESLEVREGEQIAIFTGDVVAGQGTLRLTADTVTVNYGGDGETGEIDSMIAEGNVFLSNGSETAEGARAEYDVADGMMRMSGDVVLTQGQNAISGETLVIDLEAGTGRVEGSGQGPDGGRVKSIFTPSSQ